MRKIIVGMLVVALAACGAPGEDVEQEQGQQPDLATASGGVTASRWPCQPSLPVGSWTQRSISATAPDGKTYIYVVGGEPKPVFVASSFGFSPLNQVFSAEVLPSGDL